jgi:hypothetical protein
VHVFTHNDANISDIFMSFAYIALTVFRIQINKTITGKRLKGGRAKETEQSGWRGGERANGDFEKDARLANISCLCHTAKGKRGEVKK